MGRNTETILFWCALVAGAINVINAVEQDPIYATEYGADCTKDAECSWLGSNSICLYNRKCTCQEGFTWYQGKCQKTYKLNEECDSLCLDVLDPLALTCEDNVCICSTGYYEREDNCRRKSTKRGGTLHPIENCALDLDCSDNKTCINAVCTTAKAQQSDSEEPNAITAFSQEPSDPSDVLGKSCTANTDCQSAQNSECDQLTKKCTCKHRYFNREKVCVPELGSRCLTAKDCTSIKPTQCLNNVCVCRDYWYASEDKRTCVKGITQTNKNCLSDEWCRTMGENAFCNSAETCECYSNAEFNADSFYCKINPNKSPPECKTDDYCRTTIDNQMCVDQKCICPNKYELDSEKQLCYPSEIGALCDETFTCSNVANSECAEGTCACVQESTFVKENNKCYAKASLGDDCELTQQCSVENSNCNEGMKCACLEQYNQIEGECLRNRTNEYCADSKQCSVVLGKEWECRKSVCSVKRSSGATRTFVLSLAVLVISILSQFV